jgi:hypothetical protein
LREKNKLIDRERIKRFFVAPVEYETPSGFHHCSTKREWQNYLTNHYSSKLNKTEIDYSKAISNASFRICGLELKLGILLANDEAIIANKKYLSGAIEPSIVMDSVLAIYSVLEGLTYLSFLMSIPADQVITEVVRIPRGDKIAKGMKHSIGRKVSSEVGNLRALRDRCVHQDCADLKDGLDYEHTFASASIRAHCGLLFDFLKSMETSENLMPDTNINDFFLLSSPKKIVKPNATKQA